MAAGNFWEQNALTSFLFGATGVGLVHRMGRLSPDLNRLIQPWRAKAMSQGDKKKSKFSPRQLRFLELYFSGLTIKAAARAAGYCGSSDQALCNTGGALLRRAVATDAGIAQLFLDKMLRNQSESGRLKGLSILSEAMFSRR